MKISRWIVGLFFMVIIIPVLSLIPWIFTQRLPWPQLLPSSWSMRAMSSILSKDKGWVSLIFSSVMLSTSVSVLSVVVGMLSASALARYDFKGKQLFYVLIWLPFIVPATVFGMGAQVLFIKLKIARSFIGVVLAHLMYSLPYATKLLYDGTQQVGDSLEEQARVLGATPWQAFWYATFPNLAPMILSALSMSFVVSLSQYFLTLIIGGGKIQTFSVVMVPYLHGGERSISAAYSVLFLGICLIVFSFFEWFTGRILKKRGIQGGKYGANHPSAIR